MNYQIISLVKDFQKVDLLIRKEKSINTKIKIWQRYFIKPNKDIFTTYWRWADRRAVKKTFRQYTKNYNLKQIIANERYIRKELDSLLKKIGQFVKVPNKLVIILNIGIGHSNGFVDKYKNKHTTFINLERYDDIKTLKIFLAHELIHNIQLLKNPQVYYWNKQGRRNFYHHLLLEGLATFLTKKVLKINLADALWGNYLSESEKKKFISWCEKNENNLKQKIIKIIKQPKLIYFDQYFGAGRPANCPYIRTGYYLGYYFIDKLLAHYSLKEIVMLRGDNLMEEVEDFLISLAP